MYHQWTFTETLVSLRHCCSGKFYDDDPKHVTFSGKYSKLPNCPNNFHGYKHFEEKYGYAMMIFGICKFCLYFEAEVFPPRMDLVIITN